MDSQTLLKAFAGEHAGLLKGTRSQIHAFVFIALGEAAIRLGFRAKVVNHVVAKYMGVPETSARTMRLWCQEVDQDVRCATQFVA